MSVTCARIAFFCKSSRILHSSVPTEMRRPRRTPGSLTRRKTPSFGRSSDWMRDSHGAGEWCDSTLSYPRSTNAREDEALKDAPTPETVFSRRNFVIRAGQAGIAMSIFPPGLRGLLPPPSLSDTSEALDHGILTAPVSTDLYSGLRWRMLGPFRGGRVAAVTGVPGRPNDFYFGAVNGGVWKTIDGGGVWTPIFDGQSTASIGAIAVAPSAPDTVYVGSGESTLRDSVGYGNGVYKSTDAGKTWAHLGLDETHHIGKIAIDPGNPNNVFVAAIGKLYAANKERGIFRSR